MARPIVAWSYSALGMFENCPRKYWAVKIGKMVDDGNQHNRKGDAEHAGIEHFLKQGLALPPRLAPLQSMFERIRAAPGEQYIEFKMTLTNQMVVCSGTDWNNAWVRGAADYLKVNGAKATYLDWKSGKVRKSDDQIELTALLVFRHFPAVQQVNGGLVFYAHGAAHPRIVHRQEESLLWNGWITRVRALEEAIQTNNFPVNPNPLCAYCPYKACPHNTTDAREAKERAQNGN
jgi:hypothetical protein